MGALIMTKGTKRLVAHYNDEFDTWIQFYRGHIDLFDINTYGGNSIRIWDDVVQNAAMVDPGSPVNGHSADTNAKTLLPPPHPKHKNLLLRWQYFLQTVLTPANNKKLAKGIHDALQDNNVKYIIFDVVHDNQQDVSAQPDTNEDGDSIFSIVIHTVPMRKHPHTSGGHDPDEIDT
jgi:hypothetical protein